MAKTPDAVVSRGWRGPASAARSVRRRPVASRAHEDEAVVVALDDALEPARVRRGADEHEEALARRPVALPSSRPVTWILGEPAVDRTGTGHLGQVADLDVAGRVQLGDEVLGHARGDVPAPHEQGDVGGVLREVQGGLAGRVATADDVHRVAGHRARLGDRGAVEDPAPDERLHLGQVEPAVVDPGGDDRRAGAGRGAVGEQDRCSGPSTSSPVAERKKWNTAPNIQAWWKERNARWLPLMPRAKPG